MDIKTLAHTIMLVASALALLVSAMAVFRRKRGITIYAVSYALAVASFALFLFQPRLPAWLGVFAANLLLVSHHFGLAWGLRRCLSLPRGLPRRFILYLAAYAALVAAFTWAADSFILRASISSGFIVLGAAEFLIALEDSARDTRRVIRYSARAVVLGFILCHALRAALVLTLNGPDTRLLDNNVVGVFSFSFTAFFLVLWAGLVLVLDAASLVAEKEKRNAELRGQAGTDELTELPNRRTLEAKIQAEIERSTRYREPLSLLVFDIDYFKRVNDERGHQAGDAVLRSLASLIRGHIREPDTLFRWGGDEFLVLAPHTDLAGAVALAEKLRRAVELHPFPEAGALTASFGAAELQPGLDREEWFGRADQALYRAKNTGRNRVAGFDKGDALPVASLRLRWRAEWESGDPTVDEQHRRLLESANRLLDRALARSPEAELRAGFDALLGHVAEHFADEERVLAELRYPDLAAHAGLHGELLERARDLRARAESERLEFPALFEFLVGRVVKGHLLQEDVLFFPHTRARAGRVPG